eukprot:9500251-Pyramimonas_sp.AAC.4
MSTIRLPCETHPVPMRSPCSSGVNAMRLAYENQANPTQRLPTYHMLVIRMSYAIIRLPYDSHATTI